MNDVFVSHARETESQARRIAEALRALGYGVWLDDELPAHRGYAEVLEERLESAKAVVVVWSTEAVRSEWVQSEADRAREDRKLVQLSLDGAKLPMPFDRIQCADLTGWNGEPDHPGWRKVLASVGELVGARAPPPSSEPNPPLPTRPSIVVLPFTRLSADVDQDYFADGMVEEIVAALSRMPSIFVIGSGSGLSFKGTNVVAPRQAPDRQPEGQTRRGHALRPRPLGGPDPLHYPPHRPDPEERPLRGLRRRRRTLGRHRLARRNLQAQRHRPRGLLASTITRIVRGHPQSRLGDLLPWAYKTPCSGGDLAH